MSNKFLIGIGVAFALVFAAGIAAVVGITSMTDRVTVSDYPTTSVPKPTDDDVAAKFTPNFVPFSPQVLPPQVVAASPSSVPVGPSLPVENADIDQLAAAVQLGASSTGSVGRDVWAKQLPVAQHLLHGMCDCDQRNWLNHFVQTAQAAVSGSDTYYQSVQLLATLRRNNQELSQASAH